MRWTPALLACAALALAACQPSGDDSDAALTSGPPPEAMPAEDAASDAAETESPAPDTGDEPAQQSAPPPSDTGDMGDARSREESVEPDSPTMFQ